MNDLPYWGIAAIQVWICTRELSYVQKRLTGDAQRDEKLVWDVLSDFQIGPLNLECDEELLAKPRSGESQAEGIKSDLFNKWNPVSDTAQYIPLCDWEYFGIGRLPEGWQIRSLLVSQEQAVAELLAKLRSGELQAKGIECDPANEGKPVSYTARDIPVCDWRCLKIGRLRHLTGDRYAAFFDDNNYPSWRHVVCPGAVVRQLWPQDQTETPEAAPGSNAAPGSAKRKRVTKQRIAEEAGRELFPCGGLASMTTQEISAAIEEKLKKDRPNIAKIISSKTLARAVNVLRKELP